MEIEIYSCVLKDHPDIVHCVIALVSVHELGSNHLVKKRVQLHYMYKDRYISVVDVCVGMHIYILLSVVCGNGE